MSKAILEQMCKISKLTFPGRCPWTRTGSLGYAFYERGLHSEG